MKKTDSKEDLKPCPWCGEELTIGENGIGWSASCVNAACGLCVSRGDDNPLILRLFLNAIPRKPITAEDVPLDVQHEIVTQVLVDFEEVTRNENWPKEHITFGCFAEWIDDEEWKGIGKDGEQ